MKIFHTDRGNEFKNKIIDKILDTFNIDRSLSMKGSLCLSISIESILH